MRLSLICIACAISSLGIHAQGWIQSVGNSASYARGIAQGSIFVIFGWQLGPDQLVQAPAYPLQPELAGTSVSVTAAGQTLACPMVYTSSRQVAAILPSATPTGEVMLSVTYGGQTTYPYFMTVVKSGFGVYTTSATGAGPGSITGTDYALNTFSHTAKPHDVIVLWGTGLGPAPGDDAAGPQPGVEFDGVSVYIGNQPAKLIYAGRSGGYAALDQINVEVPEVAGGCFVPVVVHSGSQVSNYVSLAVEPSGNNCTNAGGVPEDLLASAAGGSPMRVGLIALGPMGVFEGGGFGVAFSAAERVSALLGVRLTDSDVVQLVRATRSRNQKAVRQVLARYKIAPADLTPDVIRAVRKAVRMDGFVAAAAFGEYSGLGIAAAQIGAVFPAPGTCTVLKSPPAAPGSDGRGLDAGMALTLTGPLGAHSLSRYTNGLYAAELGAGFGSVLPPGMYQITGGGGRDIPALASSFTISTSLVWTNKTAVSAIDRIQPLTVTWSGGSPTGHVLIGGWAHGERTAAAFACVEQVTKGAFTIPAHVLAALPASDSVGSYIFVAQHPLDNRLNIPGLNLAYFVNASADYAQVTFR